MARNIKILDRQFVPAGTIIIEQGTVGTRAFMIERGKVEVFVRDSNGNKVVVAELGPESMIGEMAVISEGLRSASVRALEDTVLVAITAHDLHESMRASKSLFKRIVRMAVSRMEDTSQKLMKKEQEQPKEQAQPAAKKDPPLNIKNVALHVAEDQKDSFKKEITPLIQEIKSTLEKFSIKPNKK